MMGPVMADLIDTAGLAEQLALTGDIDKASQQKAIALLSQADIVLLVVDASTDESQLERSLLERIKDKKVLTVLNKSDLGVKFNAGKLDENFRSTVTISAKTGSGIEKLIEKILSTVGVAGFDYSSAVFFTQRQKRLLEGLINADSVKQSRAVITELLTGKISL